MAVGDALLDAALNNEEKARRMIVEWSYAPMGHIGNNQKVPGTWLPGNSLALMRRMAKGVLHNDLAACRRHRRPRRGSAVERAIAGADRSVRHDDAAKAAQGALAVLRNARRRRRSAMRGTT